MPLVMSLWSWLRDAFVRQAPETEARVEPNADETLLQSVLMRLVEPNEAGKLAINEREFMTAIQRLLAQGRERAAVDILRRFVAARPNHHAVSMRLAEILCDRLEHALAEPLLLRLAEVPEHALRARFLLADRAERSGDSALARQQLERILAVDLDYPQAKTRADRLPSPQPAAPPRQVAAATLAGLPERGADFGRWRLYSELGRGGAGAVYVAHDDELDRDVALKILHPQARQRTLERARAFIEARLCASIRHPGVVAIYDLDEERQLVAMELCAGGSLRARLAKGPLPPGEALERGAELFDTLAAVHARNIIHGDVKPANLLLRDRGEGSDLVLGDFGLAQLAGANDPAVAGTLAYLAPERRRGLVGAAADVYAAGVILIEMLSPAAALADWLFARAALLRGEAHWSGRLPPEVAAALGAARAEALTALLASLLAEDPEARPTAGAALTRLRGI
jgi:serine/threonine-protein kinase